MNKPLLSDSKLNLFLVIRLSSFLQHWIEILMEDYLLRNLWERRLQLRSCLSLWIGAEFDEMSESSARLLKSLILIFFWIINEIDMQFGLIQ